MMASAQRHSLHLPHPPNSLRGIIRACEEGVEFMELVAELLLLRSGSKARALHPVTTGSTDSYSKSRDAIVANTKALAISIKDLTRQLKDEKYADVEGIVGQISEKVTVLTESAAQAAYITAMRDENSVSFKEGAIDQYQFTKARYIINNTCSSFLPNREPLSNDSLVKLTQTIATNLSLVRQGCHRASENSSLSDHQKSQFSACVQCLDGSSALFVACIKSYITTNKASDKNNISVFAMPLKTAVNSVVEYSSLPEFGGSPAQLTPRGEHSQTEILAGAMSIVSAAVQMLNTVVSLLEDKVGDGPNHHGNGLSKDKPIDRKAQEDRHWQKLVSCARAVADSCKMLASSIREHTPRPTPQTTPPLQRANSSVHS